VQIFSMYAPAEGRNGKELMVKIAEIQSTVAAYYGIRLYMMTAQKRRRDLCWPRMVAMYLCRELTQKSYPVIGDAFNRHHTTVMNGVERMGDIILLNEKIACDMHRLREMLNSKARRDDVAMEKKTKGAV
jgi:chromosomal replication initiator protein